MLSPELGRGVRLGVRPRVVSACGGVTGFSFSAATLEEGFMGGLLLVDMRLERWTEDYCCVNPKCPRLDDVSTVVSWLVLQPPPQAAATL